MNVENSPPSTARPYSDIKIIIVDSTSEHET